MSAPLLDTFTGRVRLEGTLTARTALHIGAGGSGDPLATDAPVVRNAAGIPYVPGSSLKGVLRSAAESLFRGREAGDSQGDLWTCNPLAGKESVCVSHERLEEIREEEERRAEKEERDPDPRAVAEAVWAESCTVCRLFGSLALAGRVRFADLPLSGEVSLLELRNGVGIDRDKELAAKGVLYDFEAVPPDTRFDLRVIVDNPSDAEVGLLLYLFEELDCGNLSLGGKTSRGLGQVGITWEGIEEITLARQNPFAELLSTRDLLLPTPQNADDEATVEESSAEAGGQTEDDEGDRLPETGDREAWKLLVEILRELPEIEKGALGQAASDKGLAKSTLNEKLGLGLETGQHRKTWDVALGRLVECGVLVQGGPTGYVLAEKAQAEVTTEEASTPAGGGEQPGKDPLLQAAYDRFIGAMARLWEEAR